MTYLIHGHTGMVACVKVRQHVALIICNLLMWCEKWNGLPLCIFLATESLWNCKRKLLIFMRRGTCVLPGLTFVQFGRVIIVSLYTLALTGCYHMYLYRHSPGARWAGITNRGDHVADGGTPGLKFSPSPFSIVRSPRLAVRRGAPGLHWSWLPTPLAGLQFACTTCEAV